LHELFRYSNLFLMSAFTSAPGCLAINHTDVTIQPTGLMFKLYRQHFGTIPVAVNGNFPQNEVKGMIGVDKPKVTSGSDTYPLDISAALTADKKRLTIGIVNPTESVQEVEVAVRGASFQP